MKVAIVHDWLTNMGGSEKVVLQLHKLFPDAPVYTSIYNPEKVDPAFRNIEVIPSFLQKLPFSKTKYQLFLPLMPLAFEQFDLRGYDLIISSSHACAKGVIPSPRSAHICYCHTPMRYAWSGFHEYQDREKIGLLKKILILPLLHYLRMWDRLTADRVDYFVANSNEVAERIQKYYRKESTVIHPPVKLADVQSQVSDGDYYLIVSRLVAYKRVDLAVEAFNRLQKPLVVVGDGPELKRLRELAGPTVRFVGRADDEQVAQFYQECKAFVFPGEEDFGITPVEAQSFGKPVIAFGRGGAVDTVISKKTGILFYQQTVDSLMQAVQEAENYTFNSNMIRQHANSFSEEVFRQKMKNFVESVMSRKREEGVRDDSHIPETLK